LSFSHIFNPSSLNCKSNLNLNLFTLNLSIPHPLTPLFSFFARLIVSPRLSPSVLCCLLASPGRFVSLTTCYLLLTAAIFYHLSVATYDWAVHPSKSFARDVINSTKKTYITIRNRFFPLPSSFFSTSTISFLSPRHLSDSTDRY
jgi:hypothetical protein